MEIKKLSLKQARILAELTQEQAAEKIGVSKSTLVKWERGLCFPDAIKIQRIEEIYGIPYDMIMFLREVKH